MFSGQLAIHIKKLKLIPIYINVSERYIEYIEGLNVKGKIPKHLAENRREGNGTPLQRSLPGKSHGRRSLVGCSPWGR